MKYYKVKLALVLAGMVLSGSLCASASESVPDLEILSIDVVPQPEESGGSETEASQEQTESRTTTPKFRTSPAPKKTTDSETAAKKKAESEAEAKKKAESEADAKKKAESEADAKKKAESEAAAKKKAESEADAKKKAASETAVKKTESETAKKKAETEAAAKKTESEAEAAVKRAESEAEAAAKKAESEAEARKKAESEAKAAVKKAESEAEARKKAESEAKTAVKKAESEAEARKKAESEAETAVKKAQSEAEAAATKTESEAEARKKAQSEAEAAVENAQSEAEARKKAQSEAEAAADAQSEAEATAEKAQSEAEAAANARSEAEAAAENAQSEAEAAKSESELPTEEPVTEPVTEESITEFESETESETESEAETSAPRVPQGLYEIAAALNHDLVIDIRHCTVDETVGQIPQLYHTLNVNQQKFYLETLPEDQYRLSVLNTGEVLTVSENDGEILSLTAAEPSKDTGTSSMESWILEPADEDFFYIHTAKGQYLTLDETEIHDGMAVTLSEFSGARGQMWKLCPTRISSEDTADTDLVNPYLKGGRCCNLKFAIRFGSRVETLTASDLALHMIETEEHHLVLDPEFLDSYVAGLAEKYNTSGQPVRFRTTGGNDVIVYEIEHPWQLDTEGMKALLQESLELNQFKSLSPVWAQRNDTDYEADGVGDSYVEVDLTNQKVYLYKDGRQLIASDCVSGAADDPECVTPDGVYYIYLMRSPDTLDGPGYSEYVNYWMPFYQGFGLHDATWRTEFGGDIYLTDGSHGCINMPLETAERIYKTVDIGYPVVLYR